MALKTKFCAKCGKEAERLENSICTGCLLKSLNIILPYKINLRICKRCGNIDCKGNWIKSDETHEEFFKNMIAELVKLPENFILRGVELVNQRNIILKLNVFGQAFEQMHVVIRNVRMVTCEECSRHTSKAYLAKVQLRGGLDWLAVYCQNLEKYKLHILKIDPVPNGIDILFTVKEDAKEFISAIRKKHKFKIKNTVELYSWDKSKSKPKCKNITCLTLVA